MVAVSVLWIPIIESLQGGQLYIYIQSIAAALAPPIAAVYCLAISWTRMNEKGAFWGLVLGLAIGLVRMALEVVYPEPRCYEVDTRPAILAQVHYMYFATILFWVTIGACVSVSLITKPPEAFRIIRTTYWTRFDKTPRPDDCERVEIETIAPVERGDGGFQLNRLEDGFESGKKKKKTKKNRKLANSEESSSSLISKAFEWICGFHEDPIAAAAGEDEDANALLHHLDSVASLEQTSREKLFLNSCLCVIMALTVFLFIFFSVPSPVTKPSFQRMATSGSADGRLEFTDLETLLTDVNSTLEHTWPSNFEILTVETLQTTFDRRPDDSSEATLLTMGLRIFVGFLLGSHEDEEEAGGGGEDGSGNNGHEMSHVICEAIGLADFAPRKRPDGTFETFSDLVLRASRKCSSRSDIRITNIQAVDMRMSPEGFMDSRKTYFYDDPKSSFIRIVRVAFVVRYPCPNESSTLSIVRQPNNRSGSWSCRHFRPKLVGFCGKSLETINDVVRQINEWMTTQKGTFISVESCLIPVDTTRP
ncbi:unnamed protein product [Notodromas monacha]|uniref:Uncharacterized protein n=1 Tax=Notodromas monacha TaxID=399045 RepID=A0A7R9GJ51_9CRUS|nr:unnamed protein product [Notodromas monacha]CAG0923272.1 unnamed protein product [Notodromas monacha]